MVWAMQGKLFAKHWKVKVHYADLRPGHCSFLRDALRLAVETEANDIYEDQRR